MLLHAALPCLCLSSLFISSFCHLTSSQRLWVCFFHQLKARPSTGKRLQRNWLQYWLYGGIPSYIRLFDIIRRYKVFKCYQLLHLITIFTLIQTPKGINEEEWSSGSHRDENFSLKNLPSLPHQPYYWWPVRVAQAGMAPDGILGCYWVCYGLTLHGDQGVPEQIIHGRVLCGGELWTPPWKAGWGGGGAADQWPEFMPSWSPPPLGEIGLFTYHQLLGGSYLYSQTCLIWSEWTLWKLWSTPG